MKCPQCSAKMKSGSETIPYRGAPNVVLMGAQVDRCGSCGEYVLHTPAIDQLHSLITSALASKSTRLTGPEIRFMRNHLGLDSGEFAKVIGSDPGTVSRWESGKQPAGRHADLLLRALVLLHNKEQFVPNVFRDVEWDMEPSGHLTFRYAAKKWSKTTLAA